MNPLTAWKKVALFGLFGAVGCLAGWLVGEPFLAVFDAVANSAGATQAPTLISKPTAPSGDAPPLPNDIRERLEREKGKTGDVQISLIWYNVNDLDLHCVDPNGETIFYKNPRSRSGGELDVDANAGSSRAGRPSPITREPIENIYWPPGGAPQGRYQVYVNHFLHRPEAGAPNETEYKVNVLHDGERHEFKGTITNNGTSNNLKKIYEFELRPRLTLFAPNEFEIPQAKTVKVPVSVRRAYFKEPVEVKVENLPEGVIAGKTTIPEGKDEGEVELKAADDAKEVKKGVKFVATGGSLSTSADAQLSVPKPAVQFSLVMMLAIGFWTALLAVGLCLALLAGQNKYLGKSLFAPGRIPLGMVILGAVAAGFASGTIGQALYYVFLAVGVAKLGFLIGWLILGALLGWGVSFFVPNLDGKKAALAGLAGGFLGAIAFWAMSAVTDREWIGRFGGGAILGFCIGLMVAVVEVAFRRAWLEVRFSERELITVNLGPEPVKVGGDARACTVWARGAPEVALRYFIRNGQVVCNDVPGRAETVVTDGDTRTAGSVTVVVRTGSSPVAAGSAPPPLPPRPAAPPPLPASAPVAKPQAAAVPPATPQAAPASKPAQPDYDDGMPMPVGPPPARAGATSILDIDDLRAAAPAAKPQAAPAPKPQATPPTPAPKPPSPAPPAAPPAPVAKSMAPPAPKPPVPAAGKSIAPPPPVARSMAPPAPKPPAPGATAAGSPKPGDPDACPSCGRKSPGKPGSRYCMVCDKTF